MISTSDRTPLARYPVFATRDADELRGFVGAKGLALSMPRSPFRAERLDARVHACYLPRLYLCHLSYGAAIEFEARGVRPDYSISLPVRGGFRATIGGHVVDAGPGLGSVGSPVHDQHLLLPEGSSRLGVSFQQSAVVRQLEALLGEPVDEAPVFAPGLDSRHGPARSLCETIRLGIRELDREDSGFAHPLVSTQFEQLVLTQLLTLQPSNFDARLARRCRAPCPRDVRRAIDYIHAHAAEPITLTQLVEVTAVAGRTLNEHFRKSQGMSPIAYHRRVRLTRAREDLLAGAPGDTVTMVAMRWGFTHLGRFSIEYRRVYGESPRQTLAGKPRPH